MTTEDTAALEQWISRKSFLVVEDVDTSRMLVSGLLRSLGAFLILTASDGEAAMKKLDSEGAPDIILCDWEMPKMNGLQLLEVVKKTYPKTRFIMLTARVEPDDVLAARKFNADGYIAKPFTRQSLISSLGKLMARE